LATKKPPKRLIFQWTTLKGLAAILLFLIVATLIEYIVVLYAMNFGVKDETLVQWSSQFPGIDWIITITISPLFHLVPIAVIIVLVSSWTYLTRHVAVKSPEKLKGKVKSISKHRKERGFKEVKKLASKIRDFFGNLKSVLLRIRGVAYIWQKIHFARATIKSALTVLLVFGALILLVSVLTYPQLIYWTVSNAYRDDSLLLGFVTSISNCGKGIAEALAPIGWICSVVNNALLSTAPAFRDFVLSLGGLTKSLVELDDAGKYLVFQNVAAWVSALTALFYGKHKRKSYRYGKSRRR
jgi:hypothetical protein